MNFKLLIFCLAIGGCAGKGSGVLNSGLPTPFLKMDITCILEPRREVLVMNCADAETWKEWKEKQSKEK